MKEKISFSCLLLGLIIMASSASAQPDRPPQRFDANKDGQVSQQEISSVLTQRFKQLDKDGDGQLTLEEFHAHAPNNQRKPETLFEKWDTNGDGQIAGEELAGKNPLLERFDKNHDGIVSSEELNQMPSEQRSKFLQRFDKNGNGQIDKEEIAEKGNPLIKRLDANKDGVISRQEFSQLQANREQKQDAHFKQLDTNHDGKLSQDEFLKDSENAFRWGEGKQRGH